LQRFQAVSGFLNLEAHVFEDAARDFAYYAAVVDDKAASHGRTPSDFARLSASAG
jgi:hypothetical protein